MTMTKEQVQRTSSYHADGCYIEVGPRGGLTWHIESWRASGKFQSRPRSGDWFQPIKFGLRTHGRITAYSARTMHAAEDCPLLHSSYNTDGPMWAPYSTTDTLYPLNPKHIAYRVSNQAIAQPRKFMVGLFDQGKLVASVTTETSPTPALMTWQEADHMARRLTQHRASHHHGQFVYTPHCDKVGCSCLGLTLADTTTAQATVA